MRDRRYGFHRHAAVNVCLAVLIFVFYCATSMPLSQTAMSSVYGGPILRGSQKGTVALECAVDWNAAQLPKMLDILKGSGEKITFFVSGAWAKKNSELLCEMVRQGHEIGTMGSNPAFDGTLDEVNADIRESVEAIEAACGVKPTLYYSGGRNERVSGQAAKRLGLRHVLCSVDVLSARGTAEDVLLRASEAPFDGSIMLMQPTAALVEALPAILASLKKQGWTMTGVSRMLGM
jgi:peptidoglycan/xylan/chitin deacetylase (PgdA/CDA1 family)